MKMNKLLRKSFLKNISLIILLLAGHLIYGQTVNINLAGVDGVELTPDNLTRFQVISTFSQTQNAKITGTISYKKSGLKFSYSFNTRLAPGTTDFSDPTRSLQYTFSDNALKELFLQYKRLPEGNYEYCVEIKVYSGSNETNSTIINDCVYNKSEDIFLINLLNPDNNAKIYEYNPLLMWTVNYPFASMLTYKLRVVAMQSGQNAVNAINRNNPIYQEGNLFQMSQMYPTYAKPLVVNQPYAWTVDAYYKGLLLGGAAPWVFTIVEDSLYKILPSNISYYDFVNHKQETVLYALDTLKLKYNSRQALDSLSFSVTDMSGKQIPVDSGTIHLTAGENYINVNLQNGHFSHGKNYRAHVMTTTSNEYTIPFLYINSIYIQKNK